MVIIILLCYFPFLEKGSTYSERVCNYCIFIDLLTAAHIENIRRMFDVMINFAEDR